MGRDDRPDDEPNSAEPEPVSDPETDPDSDPDPDPDSDPEPDSANRSAEMLIVSMRLQACAHFQDRVSVRDRVGDGGEGVGLQAQGHGADGDVDGAAAALIDLHGRGGDEGEARLMGVHGGFLGSRFGGEAHATREAQSAAHSTR